jgi:hypothetical protein
MHLNKQCLATAMMLLLQRQLLLLLLLLLLLQGLAQPPVGHRSHACAAGLCPIRRQQRQRLHLGLFLEPPRGVQDCGWAQQQQQQQQQ